MVVMDGRCQVYLAKDVRCKEPSSEADPSTCLWHKDQIDKDSPRFDVCPYPGARWPLKKEPEKKVEKELELGKAEDAFQLPGDVEWVLQNLDEKKPEKGTREREALLKWARSSRVTRDKFMAHVLKIKGQLVEKQMAASTRVDVGEAEAEKLVKELLTGA